MDNELTQNRQNALSSLWHESKEREAQRKALKLNLDYIDLDKTPIESDALETIPFEIATKLNLIPFQISFLRILYLKVTKKEGDI